MSLPLLALISIAGLLGAYLVYGRLLAASFRLDDAAVTPAVLREDGQDFVPTRAFYLLPQHFSAIAAAGPIVGPIAACGQFGWLPCLLWIGLGVVFIGAVHDLSALVASVRHGARSVAEIVRQNLSPRAWLAMMLFIWLALIYVIVAFTDVTAGTFLGRVEGLEGVPSGFNAGGAVAFASIAYLGLAIAMGLAQAWLRLPLWAATLIFVPATLGAVWLGTRFSELMVLEVAAPQRTWGLLLLGYCFVASLLPVWLLLQPRGYLGGFVLYLVLIVGVIGILFGGFAIEQPSFKGFDVGGATGLLFPFLFVTIACGACSGFHGLVCGGTTSKQIALESHCRSVGYGAMLLEAFVAVIALATIMIAVPPAGTPAGSVYGQGIGQFLSVIIGREHLAFAVVFGAMAFSTFVFDTLDVATRLGRYILQELFEWRGRGSAVAATALTAGVPALFLLSAGPPAPGRPPAYLAFWTLFGTSNQLLASLTLLAITIWLRRSGRAYWFTLAPMCFVMTTTVWALLLQAYAGFRSQGSDGGFDPIPLLNAVVACALLALAAMIVAEAIRVVRGPSLRPAPSGELGA